jgi:hypothetical protein
MSLKYEVVSETEDYLEIKFPDLGLTVGLEGFRERDGDLAADITIADISLGKTALLHSSRVNLSSTRARLDLVRLLKEKAEDVGPTWGEILELVFFLAQAHYREGSPVVSVGEIREPTGEPWVLEPLAASPGPTVLFADGGSGKSYLAIAVCVSLAAGRPVIGNRVTEPGPTLYLDWETDAQAFQRRVLQVARGAGIPAEVVERAVYYKRMEGSLTGSVKAVRRAVRKIKPVLVVVDSAGMAKGDEPQGTKASIDLMRAVRSLGAPTLVVDHLDKFSQRAGFHDKPFGSVYTFNLARVVWSLRSEVIDKGLGLLLENEKRNDGEKLGRLAYRMVFEDDRIRFEPVEASAEPALEEKLPVTDRLLLELRRGAATPKELADRLGLSHGTVKNALWRLLRQGKLIRLDGGKYGLSYN